MNILLTKTSGPPSWLSEVHVILKAFYPGDLVKYVTSHILNVTSRLRVYKQTMFGFLFMQLKWLWMTGTTYAGHFYIQSRLQSVYLPAAPHTDNLFLLSPRHSISCVSCGWSKKTYTNLHPGQRSSVSLFWSLCWIIVICRRNASLKVASSKSET